MEETIIPITAILMPLVLVPTIITLKHRHKRREWEHLERMKALEMGQPNASRREAWGAQSIVKIGAGVPIASVVAALLTCAVEGPASVEGVPLAAIAWGCAAMISGGAMLTSLILAVLLVRSQGRLDAARVDPAKVVYDPDAYDVVGSRG